MADRYTDTDLDNSVSRTRLHVRADWRRKSMRHVPLEKNREKSLGGTPPERRAAMYNIFYIIGVVVVVLFILGYLGLR
jgi:hypothetical protein